MIFMIILTVLLAGLTALFIWAKEEECTDFFTIVTLAVLCLTICLKVNAKKDSAIMRAHLENPTNYTYSQLAEHNEHVTELKFWHGTIFSFYNDVDLQTIDIDNVSQKIIIK